MIDMNGDGFVGDYSVNLKKSSFIWVDVLLIIAAIMGSILVIITLLAMFNVHFATQLVSYVIAGK